MSLQIQTRWKWKSIKKKKKKKVINTQFGNNNKAEKGEQGLSQTFQFNILF